MKQRFKRPLALLLTVVMLLGLLPTAAFAVEEDGLCPHHLQHDDTCGYVAAVDGQPCQHQHDETCGYTEGTPEVPCDKGCTDTDDDGVIDHVEDCSYRPAVPGSPCTHSHDADCGYVEGSEESPCRYECGVCPVEELIQALPDPIQSGDAAAVEEAQTAYTALTEEECAQIDPVLTEKLFQAVDTLLLLAEEDPDAAQPSLQPTQQIQLQEDEIPLTVEGGELESGTYVLTGDLTLTNNITISDEIGTEVIINLNGHTLTGNGNGSVITYLPTPKSDAKLTINGAGEDGTPGTITGGTGTEISIYGEKYYYGGGIYVDTADYVPVEGEGENELVICDVKISGNKATNGGGAFIGVIASAELNGVTFSENTADRGGGLYSNIGGSGTIYRVSLQECTFTENTAHRGGGLYASGAFQCVNTSFSDNTATINEDDAESGNGGAIYYNSSVLRVLGCTIERNRAEKNGGGVYATSGGMSIFSTSFVNGVSRSNMVKDNTAAEYGGGLYLEQRVTFYGDITDNTAKTGGGIYLAKGHVKLSGAAVTENEATDASEGALGGGGIAMSFTKVTGIGDDASTINNCVISGNKSAAGGGGVSILIGGTDAQHGVSFNGSTISGNTAAGDGGGVLLRVEKDAPACEKGSSSYSDFGFSLSDTVVESNKSTGGSGGGIAIDRQGDTAWGTEIDLSDVTIRENKAKQEGGGAAIRGVRISFDEESPVFGNLSDTAGDDVYFTTPGALTLPTPKAQNIQNLGRWYKDEENARYREGNSTDTLESIENGSETYALTAGEIVVLTFDPAGGKLASGTETPVYAAKNSEISAPKDPTNGSRNRFLGWFTGSKSDSGEITYGELVDFSQPVEESMDLFAKWQAFYLVKFELGYGASFPEGVETAIQVDVEQPVTRPADPTRQGYQFNGWVDEDGTPWQFETVVTEDMTLCASWERTPGAELPSVILHAETYGGSPAPEDQVLPKAELMDGTAVPQPLGEPALDGVTFKYWYVDYLQLLRVSGMEEEANETEQELTSNIAHYKELLEDPETPEEQKAEIQEIIDSCEKMLYEYHHAVLYGEDMGFSEEDLRESGIDMALSYPEDLFGLLTYACHYVPDEDTAVTLHAQWSKEGELVETMATLTYESNGGTTYAEEQYPSGAVVPLKKIPTRPGFDFTGWYADSSLSEKVTSLTMDGDKTVYAGWVPRATGTITVTPADIIIYMGGKDGYEGTVNQDGNIVGSQSLPEPGFVFDLPPELETALDATGEDITDVKFQNEDGTKTWIVQLYQGLDKSATRKLYTIVPTYEDHDPVRVVFTDGDKHIVSDEFTVGLEINKDFGMSLYTGLAGEIKAVYDGKEYPVELGEGILTVLGTTEEVSITTVTETAPTNGQAGAVATAGTTYTINNSEVAVTGGDVSLLFDNIINHTGNDRTSKLEERASEWLAEEGIVPTAQHQFVYELKYLDLVDANNGNAWVTASQDLTIYWPLPTGADADSLKVLHFKDLHRDMTTGEIESEIDTCDVESLTFQVVGNYITFEVGRGGFSPFALVWEEKIPTYTITATSNGNGSITPAGVTTVQEGGSQSYTIKADSGYHISDVKVNGVSVGAVESYTFTNVRSNQTIAVTFSRNSSGGGGGGGGHTKPSDPDEDIPDEPGPADPFDTGVGNWLNTKDHNAYLGGYTDGTIRPEGNITRAEVATIFFRLMTDEYREDCWSQHSGFTDVSSASWYNNAVSTTAQAGWITGYEDCSFRPDAYITRAEFATIAARFLSEGYAGGHRFNDIQGHWAAEYINRAAAAGWIGGYEDGTFRPNAYITRAEVATLVNRMLDRAPDVGHLLADMVRWPDNPETAWYYADIQEATNSHDYTRAGTGNYEVWTELLANRDWAALEEIWSQANDAPGGEVADGLTPNGN